MSAVLLPAVLFAVAPVADAPATHTLRYRFEPGTSLRYEIETRSTIYSKQAVQGGAATEQTVRQTGRTVQRLDVLPAKGDGGVATLRVVSETIKLSARETLNGIARPAAEWDSETGLLAPPEFAQVAKVVGVPMHDLTVRTDGEVVRADSHLPRPKGSPEPDGDPGQYRHLFPRLPEQPVAVGDAWEDRFTTKLEQERLPKPWTLRRQFTLEAVTDGVAVIRVKISPLPPPFDVDLRRQLAGRCPTGTVRFDIERGVMLGQTATVDSRVVNFRGAGTLLRIDNGHEQTLSASGPTAELAPSADLAPVPRTAAALRGPRN